MTPERPLVSVIIPVFNGARFLPEALASVRWQNYEPLEIIVVDDGSTDDTAAVVADLGDDIRYIFQQNAGPAAARNRGIRAARGELIGLLDADDQWPKGKFNLQVSRLEEDTALDVVCGRIQYILLPGAKEPDIVFEPDNTITYVHLGSALYRRRAFDRVGLFDEALHYAEDHDWFLRAREENTPLVILEQITLLYRLHDRNMTRDHKVGHRFFVRALKKSLDRRRRQPWRTGLLKPWSEYDEAADHLLARRSRQDSTDQGGPRKRGDTEDVDC